MHRIIQALLAAIMLSAALAACNTMEGLGEDIQHGGQKLEKEANQHK
jgi:predicted small secreted protein